MVVVVVVHAVVVILIHSALTGRMNYMYPLTQDAITIRKLYNCIILSQLIDQLPCMISYMELASCNIISWTGQTYTA